MQYQVPQFIEIEDKIFGPLTLKQFIYLAGGGGICLMFYTILPLYLTFLLGLPFVVLSLGLAFYKVNDRPLIDAVEHAFKYFFGNKLYLWKARSTKPQNVESAGAVAPGQAGVTIPTISESKLKDLSWSLNIKDRAAAGDTVAQQSGLAL